MTEQQDLTVMHEFNSASAILAKFPGSCELCHQRYQPGDRILWMPGRAIHESCPQLTMDLLSPAPPFTQPIVSPTPLADGTYTCVFASGVHLTIRVQTAPAHSDLRDRVILSYLYGPDNERDFRGFAFWNPATRTAHPWARFKESFHACDKHDRSLAGAISILLQDPVSAGETYAIQSGRCYRCNRKLTVPASLHRGMGPVCSRGGRD